jgi:hypothetical protein
MTTFKKIMNGIKISWLLHTPPKTESVVFSRKKQQQVNHHTIQMNNIPSQQIQNHTNLNITLLENIPTHQY